VVQTGRHAEPIRCWAGDVPAFRDMPAMELTAERSNERVTLLRAFWYGIYLKERATKQHEGARSPSEVQFPASANQAAVDESKSPYGFSPP
jgi:hypothetical protein